MEKEFYVIVFDSTHHAIKTENQLKKQFQIEIIPTPREISASCGLSIRFSSKNFSEIMEQLNTEEGKYRVFKMEKQGNRKSVTQIL